MRPKTLLVITNSVNTVPVVSKLVGPKYKNVPIILSSGASSSQVSITPMAAVSFELGGISTFVLIFSSSCEEEARNMSCSPFAR